MTIKVFCDICEAEIPEASEGEEEDVGVLSFTYGAIGADPQPSIVDFEHLCDKCVDVLKKAIKDAVDKCNLAGIKRRHQLK